MIKNNYPGKFIVLEGLDGAGKSTQSRLIAQNFGRSGKNVFITGEPTEGLIGQMARRRLRGEWECRPECLQLLFAADRACHLEKEILPRLREGILVVSDRYFLSSLAYGAVNCDLEWLAQINSRFLAPDLTIYLDVPAHVCAQRIINDKKSIELFERVEILEIVGQNYNKAIRMFEDQMKIAVVGGNQNKEKVFAGIKKSLKIKN